MTASSSSLTGGVNASGVYDEGYYNLTMNGIVIASAPYNASSTPTSIAQALVTSGKGNGLVSLTSNGASLTMTAAGDGTVTDYAYSVSVSSEYFSSPSFSASSTSGDLAGGQNVPLYSWAINSYAPNGDVLSVTDSVMGTWAYTYDDLNRLATGSASAGSMSGLNLGWDYDRYGNRWDQNASGSGSAVQTHFTFSGNNNRIDQYSGNYDADGNLKNDGTNSYVYDAENRLITLNGLPTYIYDAEGRRVAKYSDGSISATYILGLGGQQITELNGSGAWKHSNVFTPAGKLLATYEGPAGSAAAGYHFHLTDWLGTARMQTNNVGSEDEACISYPFGDGLSCTGPRPTDATEQHFTGKERDPESGLDYFGARYYASNMGRFMSPDWSAKADPVPYAKLGNPQTLNLYGYMQNNPLGGVDQDGHCSGDDCAKITVTASVAQQPTITSSNGGKTGTVEGEVHYAISYDGKPLANAPVHEDVTNKTTRDGQADPSKTTTNDDKTNAQGVIGDAVGFSITPPLGGAEGTLTNSVFSKDTTQVLTLTSPAGSTCSVTETRTLSNADANKQPSDDYKITLTSPTVQRAAPVTPPPTQKQPQ